MSSGSYLFFSILYLLRSSKIFLFESSVSTFWSVQSLRGSARVFLFRLSIPPEITSFSCGFLSSCTLSGKCICLCIFCEFRMLIFLAHSIGWSSSKNNSYKWNSSLSTILKLNLTALLRTIFLGTSKIWKMMESSQISIGTIVENGWGPMKHSTKIHCPIKKLFNNTPSISEDLMKFNIFNSLNEANSFLLQESHQSIIFIEVQW